MAHFVYSPADPFSTPPVGGSTYILALLPTSFTDVHVMPGKLWLDGGLDGRVTFTGSGFGLSVESGVADVTAGTINGLKMQYQGQLIVTVTGLNINAEVLYNYLAVDNYIGYFNMIAKGHDLIDGTGFGDSITGWAGNDTIRGVGGSDSLSGYNGHDSILGGRGNDSLTGEAGKDTLIGGQGADVFLFGSVEGLTGFDIIRDFQPGQDEFQMSDDAFSTIGPVGNLAAGAFRNGSAAQDASDRIIYQKSTGWLFYDPDGTGVAEQSAFARVTAGLTLTAADFVVIN